MRRSANNPKNKAYPENHEAMGNIEWTPASRIQSEGRANRKGNPARITLTDGRNGKISNVVRWFRKELRKSDGIGLNDGELLLVLIFGVGLAILIGVGYYLSCLIF